MLSFHNGRYRFVKYYNTEDRKIDTIIPCPTLAAQNSSSAAKPISDGTDPQSDRLGTVKLLANSNLLDGIGWIHIKC